MTKRRWIADSFTPTHASLRGHQAQHLARVLRAQPGIEADIVAGDRVFRGIIESVTEEGVVFSLGAEVESNPALPVTVLLAIYKFDRMEWAIEKLTELGVFSIEPIVARRTEKHLALAAEKRVERWRRIAHEAAKQSRRAEVPTVVAPVSLGTRLSQKTSATRILLAEEEHRTSLLQCLTAALDASAVQSPHFEFAVGPEGGWAPEELAVFSSNGWASASLGIRILRAETAAIAAISVASALLS